MTCGPQRADNSTAGFTLIELLVSLALFALISLAGISLVETIVGVQQRTALRADRLAEIQRSLYLITADFEQLTDGPARDGNALTLTRGSADGPYSVAYRIDGGAVHRAANGSDLVILDHVRTVNWRFFTHGGWLDRPAARDDKVRPTGVEITFELDTGQGRTSVRRVIELPATL